MVYNSTLRGKTERETGRATVYYGLTYHIPKDVYGTDKHLEIETAYQAKVDKLIAEGIDDQGGFPKGGTVERYEAWDIDSDDVLVMWRIPIQDRNPNANDRSPRRSAYKGKNYN